MGQGVGDSSFLYCIGQGLGPAPSAEVAGHPQFPHLEGSPLAMNYGGRAGSALSPHLIGLTTLPFNYGAGMGGAAAANSSLTFARAAPRGAVAAVSSDAWMRGRYGEPPYAVLQTVTFISEQQNITPFVAIEESIAFPMSLVGE